MEQEWNSATDEWRRDQSALPRWARPAMGALERATEKIKRTVGQSTTLALSGYGLCQLPLSHLAKCAYMQNIRTLDVTNNAVERINFNDLANSDLTQVWLSMNRLEEVDVSPLKYLEFLSVYENGQTLTRLKLGQKSDLTTLYASGNPHLERLEGLEQAPKLQRFQCMGSALETIDLRHNHKLEYLAYPTAANLKPYFSRTVPTYL